MSPTGYSPPRSGPSRVASFATPKPETKKILEEISVYHLDFDTLKIYLHGLSDMNPQADHVETVSRLCSYGQRRAEMTCAKDR